MANEWADLIKWILKDCCNTNWYTKVFHAWEYTRTSSQCVAACRSKDSCTSALSSCQSNGQPGPIMDEVAGDSQLDELVQLVGYQPRPNFLTRSRSLMSPPSERHKGVKHEQLLRQDDTSSLVELKDYLPNTKHVSSQVIVDNCWYYTI